MVTLFNQSAITQLCFEKAPDMGIEVPGFPKCGLNQLT